MPTIGSPAEAAQAYQATLEQYYGHETLDMARPLFDVTLLGLGENGHTASLFPDTPALEESLAWVAPVTQGVPQPRLTLTYPAIACSNYVAFLVAGAGKADVLRRVLDGDRSQPAARVTAAGSLIWFTDKAALKE
jgi:6-phosphogluconolactonase